jgi:hypothetical protein
MGRYNGPAVLIDHHGVAHDVHALLYSSTTFGVTRWWGFLAGDASWWDIFYAREPVTLRIGDGVAAVFVTAPGGVNAITETEVTGTGPPPFD